VTVAAFSVIVHLGMRPDVGGGPRSLSPHGPAAWMSPRYATRLSSSTVVLK
jgi:hypothetical protein